MEKIIVKEMDEKRFNAIAGYSRSPVAAYVSQELGWYSNYDESVIGILLLDTIDSDYVAVVLGRDEGGRFRTFDLECSIPNRDEARKWLINTVKWHTGQDKKIFPQGDASRGLDLFTPIVAPEKLHIFFSHLQRDRAFIPARELIRNMMPHFVDVDGNFVEQFQTTGFDSRLWELFLFAYLSEEELFINRKNKSPDFLIQKYGKTVAMEAVIVGRKENNPPRYFRSFSKTKSPNEVLKEHEDAMPIKFGSPLYTKLQIKYWELPHVKGNPLVLAIADFHDDASMLWSSTALINYLYGVKHDFYYNEENKLVINPIPIKNHKLGNKEIPSGFFFQENAENISAVLFSASGTISKFNRIGRQSGFKDDTVMMVRVGTCHDHDPNAAVPKMFKYVVDEQCEEAWADGVSMFHNPNANIPVPTELFPSIAHHFFKNGQIVSNLPDFYPYASWTLNMKLSK